ncbi:YbaB/EbfC family nucleoid-associated protein [Actinomadura rupiterrae]|uniref:YbaB/EbfC family nucleoid-associated protein n=1 Tax=Actinomadura rupiterrae TaxID=559627 RepID=UPI0020A4802C|nr:YbaB/EbfC family nucleoid-associated protein [Actinomadura rupiterrae]MCP2335985.1 DNA-binding protein YbaB [Actinomadura rupiterrae]
MFDQSPEAIEKALENLTKDAKEKLERYAEMREQVAAMRSTAQSADGNVTVTVAPGGAITDINLSERAMRQSAQQLSATLMSTIAAASADVSRRMAAAVAPLAPAGMDVQALVESRLPTPPREDA